MDQQHIDFVVRGALRGFTAYLDLLCRPRWSLGDESVSAGESAPVFMVCLCQRLVCQLVADVAVGSELPVRLFFVVSQGAAFPASAGDVQPSFPPFLAVTVPTTARGQRHAMHFTNTCPVVA